MANLSSFTHFIHRLSCGTELNFTVRLGTTWGSINDDKMFILHERSLNSPVWKAIQWFLMPFLLNKKNTNNTNKKKNYYLKCKRTLSHISMVFESNICSEKHFSFCSHMKEYKRTFMKENSCQTQIKVKVLHLTNRLKHGVHFVETLQ